MYDYLAKTIIFMIAISFINQYKCLLRLGFDPRPLACSIIFGFRAATYPLDHRG